MNMGVKYVDNFSFPSDFGFTGSSADRATTTVKSHERARPLRFAEGGSVPSSIAKILDKRPSMRTPAEQKLVDDYNDTRASIPIMQDHTPPPAAAPAPAPAGPLSGLKGVGQVALEKRMRENGLARGGVAKPKGRAYAKGGIVYSNDLDEGSALERRSKPTNELDAESGGRTPLRPGFKSGGKTKRAIGGPVKAKKGGTMCAPSGKMRRK
jgi:hypothetical protein